MADLPTRDDLFRVARDEALTRNAKITRDAIERDGMDANLLVASGSAMGDEVVGQVADLAAALYLDAAKGADLDHLVFDRYGLTRKAAAASIGSAQFSTTAPSPGTFTIPTGVIVQTSDGIQFVTTEAAVFVVGTTGPVTVAVRSVLAGANQNARLGAINSIVSAISGAPADLKVTNSFATAGADDEEKDDALRDRARRFFTTARRGTNKALELAALDVAGVRKASAIEVIDALGRPARMVQLVVADAFTEQFVDYSTVPPKYQTQSQVLASIVSDALGEWRPAGTFVQVIVANVVMQPVQLALSFEAGADVNASALQARAAIVNYVNSLAPGAQFDVNAATNALKLVPGLVFTGTEITSPVGNVVAKPLQVIRTTLGLVAALAAQTNTPLITGTNPDSYVLATG